MIVLAFLVVVTCCSVCESVHIVPVCSFLGPRANYNNRRVNVERSKIVRLYSDMEKLSDLSISQACLLPLDNSRGLDELFDKLRNPASCTVDTFMTTLNSLTDAHVDRKSIPDDVVKSIVEYVADIRDRNNCIDAMHSLNMLKVEATDFDSLFLDKFQSICELTLTSSPKAVFKLLGALPLLKHDKVSPGIITAIDKALAVVFKDSFIRYDGVLSELGYLGFTWSSLSDETRVGLQHAINAQIPQMKDDQLNKILFALSMMKAKYSELPIVKNIIVMHCNNYIKSIDTALLLDSLSHIEVPWSVLSLQTQKKLEPLFIEYFRSERQGYTLFNFALMNFCVSDGSEELKEFIKVELSKHLDKLTPDQYSIVFKQLSDINIKWSMFNAESQQQLLNIISRLLPEMNDGDSWFAMSALVAMRVPYEQLTEDLMQKVQQYAGEVLRTSTTKGFCSTVNSLGKMGFKYASLSEDTKKLLHTQLLTHLTASDHKGVDIILVGLNGMGVTSSDLSEELRQCIGSLLGKHKTDLNKMLPRHKKSLNTSLKSIFMMNNN